MSGGILQYTSTIAVGGVALTSAIQKYFKVTQKEADKIKNEKGFAHYRQNAELFETLMSTVSALKDEIYKRYTYWNTRVNHRGENPEKIEKIFLCGGSSNLAGLPDYLMSGIQVPVVVSNVWSNVFSFEDAIPPVNRTASLAYATVIGLALRQFE
jgi:type IV pilus assembly protein PilM